jgi:glycosyltransferase involved in cell wall biosynthesis
MKLLIITQILDAQDSNLGFFHRWVEEFARRCEKVIVICLKEGEHHLPGNVRVLSLGKERGASRLTRIWQFFSYIRSYKDEYDAVFVHMNPEYIVLGGRFWHRNRKKISLWYAHKSVTRALKLAVRRLDAVFTVSEASFRVPTQKLHVVGHGIDTEVFKPDMREASLETRLVTSGRIAPSKHLVEMIQALDALHAKGEKFTFTIVGAPVTPQEKVYERHLKEEIAKRPFASKITLMGAVGHDQLPAILNRHDVFLNFGDTGNMDKAGLEALAVGIPLVTTNEAFEPLLAPFGLYAPEGDYEAIAAAIIKAMERPDRAAMAATLRGKVVENHSLGRLIPRILAALSH